MKTTYRRHGDLLIEKISEEPTTEGLVLNNEKILLEGEQSNHFHRLKGVDIEVYRKPNIVLADKFYAGFFRVPDVAELTHEEHDTITLEKGIYKFRIQREYSPLDERRVID